MATHSSVQSNNNSVCLQFWRPGFDPWIGKIPWLKLMSIESVMPASHLILCRSLLLLPSILPSIRVTNSQSSLRLMSIESVMPSSHLILCRPLLLLPPIPPSPRHDEDLREPLVRPQGSHISMHVARRSASLFSSHGRGPGPRDALKNDSRGPNAKPTLSLMLTGTQIWGCGVLG